VLLGKIHVGEHVVVGCVHHGRELGLLLAQGVGNDSPLRFGVDLGFLREDRIQHRRHRSALLSWGVGENVSQPASCGILIKQARADHQGDNQRRLQHSVGQHPGKHAERRAAATEWPRRSRHL
jgi:hypothetical protein